MIVRNSARARVIGKAGARVRVRSRHNSNLPASSLE